MEEKKWVYGIELTITNTTSEEKVFQLPRFVDLFSPCYWTGDDNYFYRDGVSVKADIGAMSYKEFLSEFQLWKCGIIECVSVNGGVACLRKLKFYEIDKENYRNKVDFEKTFILPPFDEPRGRICEDIIIEKNTIIELTVSAESCCVLTFHPKWHFKIQIPENI